MRTRNRGIQRETQCTESNLNAPTSRITVAPTRINPDDHAILGRGERGWLAHRIVAERANFSNPEDRAQAG